MMYSLVIAVGLRIPSMIDYKKDIVFGMIFVYINESFSGSKRKVSLPMLNIKVSLSLPAF